MRRFKSLIVNHGGTTKQRRALNKDLEPSTDIKYLRYSWLNETKQDHCPSSIESLRLEARKYLSHSSPKLAFQYFLSCEIFYSSRVEKTEHKYEKPFEEFMRDF